MMAIKNIDTGIQCSQLGSNNQWGYALAPFIQADYEDARLGEFTRRILNFNDLLYIHNEHVVFVIAIRWITGVHLAAIFG